MSRRAAHWIVLVVGLVGAAWLLWTLGLTVGERAAYGGLSVLPTSPTIQHKIGLLLISAPLWATALTRASRPDRDAARILAKGWPVILIGAALNVVAWWNAAGSWTEPTRLWFAALALIAVGAPPLLHRRLAR